MANPITYSIANDTATGKFDGGAFKREIENTAAITIGVSTIGTKGDVITVTFKVDLPAADETELDKLIAAHTGDPLTSPVQVQLHPTQADNLNLFIHGTEFMADCTDVNNGVTEHDFNPNEDREIEGALCHVYDHEPGDRLDLEFWAPTGQAEPNHEVMVGRNGCDVYVPPSGEIPEIRSETTKPLPSGVFVRIRYTCVRAGGGTKPRVAVNFRWHRASAT